MKTISPFIIALFVISLKSQAHVLVVSDIDDTLKISHTLDTVSAAQNIFNTDNNFRGMSQLLGALRAKDGVRFVYVSNAPASTLQLFHEEFLLLNRYPQGPALLRDSVLSGNHKFATISQLVRAQQPGMVVLIGDNGEEDPEIYSRLQSAFPDTPVHAFIHQVYSVQSWFEVGSRLRRGQIGYVTSVDLAGEMEKLGLLPAADYQQFIQSLVPEILREREDQYLGTLAFPDWLDCRDYVFSIDAPTEPLLQEYRKKLLSRCQGN